MNRVSLPFVKSFLIALLAVSSVAIAAEEKKPQAAPKADAAKGEALYTNGDNARGIAACVSCHGAAGNSTIAQNPKLAEQHEAYLLKQLVEFKGASRNNAIMSSIAKAMTADEMKNVSAYLAAQKQTPGAAKNKDTVAFGKQIYRAGIAEKNIPACAACHGPGGAGIPAQFARIGGQHQDYTIAQLNAFSSGARTNSEQMVTISKRLSKDEIEAVADYVAGLR